MPFKDLPLTTVPGFTGSIGQFVDVQLGADGHPVKVIINPAGKSRTVVDDRASAARYLKECFPAIMGDYKVLRVGQHTRIDVTANIGFRESVGAVRQGTAYVGTYALDGTLVPTGVPFADNQLFFHLALDSLLQYTIEVDVAKAGLVELAESIKAILDAPDAETAAKLRAEMIAERKEARQAFQAAKRGAALPGFTRPQSLTVTIDGVQTDAYTGIVNGTRLYKVHPLTGKPTKASITWDGSDAAIMFLMNNSTLSTSRG